LRRVAAVVLVLLMVGLPGAALAGAEDPVEQVLTRYFAACGGLERLKAVTGLTLRAQAEAFEYAYTVTVCADGRMRLEDPSGLTICDGHDYWRTFYGLAVPATPEEVTRAKQITLADFLFHGLFGPDGQPVSLTYKGKETKHGQTYEILSNVQDGRERKFYFNAMSGLLDKIVELVPDQELRELVNVYQFGNYLEVGGIKLPGRAEALSVTTGDQLLPGVRYSDLALNTCGDAAQFAKPQSQIPPVIVDGGVLTAQVIGVSGRGSLVTNVTVPDLQKLALADGVTVVATLKDKTFRLRYVADIQAATDVASGDYLATFNGTPALWLVKAFVGLTSEVQAAVGDPVKIALEAKPKEEAAQ
jgi:hypothetical protein